MTANIQQEEALKNVLVAKWEQASRKIAELAEVIPDHEYDSRPLAGIRSCGKVFRHVAFWNEYAADTLNGKQADDSGNELPHTAYSTKPSILEVLKQSSEAVATAFREQQAPADSKAMELIMSFVEHTAEHYGQLVVYTRFMGMVPPVSRA